MREEKEPSGAQKAFGEFAPDFVHFTDDVLFAQVWPRTELPPKERSLVTVSVLAALGASEQLTYHLGLAKQNGNTETELKEAITHIAFYAGAAGDVRHDGGQAGLRRLTIPTIERHVVNPTYDFTGRVAFVTGASSGMGWRPRARSPRPARRSTLADVNDEALLAADRQLTPGRAPRARPRGATSPTRPGRGRDSQDSRDVRQPRTWPTTTPASNPR